MFLDPTNTILDPINYVFFKSVNPFNSLIHEERLKIDVFKAAKILVKKQACFLSHLKTRDSYDLPLYFPQELLTSF